MYSSLKFILVILYLKFGQSWCNTVNINTMIYMDVRGNNISIPFHVSYLSSQPKSEQVPIVMKASDNVVQRRGDVEIETTKQPVTTPQPSFITFRPSIYSRRDVLTKTQEKDCNRCTDCIQRTLKDSSEEDILRIRRQLRVTESKISKNMNRKEVSLNRVLIRSKRDLSTNKIDESNEELRTSHYVGSCGDNTKVASSKFIGANCNSIIDMNIEHGRICFRKLQCPRNKVYQENFCSPRSKTDFFQILCTEIQVFISSVSYHYSQELNLIDKEICSVDSNIIKNCTSTQDSEYRRISIVRINGAYLEVTKQHYFQFDPDLGVMGNYKCKACKDEECLSCDGDSIYKRHIGKSKENPCYCEFRNNTYGLISLFIEGNKIMVEEMMTKISLITREKSTIAKKRPSVTMCRDCEFSCSNTMVHCNLLPEIVKKLKFCSRISCQVYNKTNNYALPYSMLLIENLIVISMYDEDDNLVYSNNVQCKIENKCNLIDCKLCLKNILNIDCYDTLDKIYILIISILAALFLVIISKILKVLILSFRILMFIFKILKWFITLGLKLYYRLRGFNYVKGKRIYTKVSESGDAKIEIKTEQSIFVKEPIKSPAQIRNEYYSMRTLSTNVLLIIFLFGLFSCSLSCTVLSTTVLEEESCIQTSQGKTTCSSKNKIEILLPGFGGDSCLVIKSAAGTIIGSLKFKISSVKARCLQEKLYYTFNPVLRKETSCHCWPSSLCEEANCFAYNGSKIIEGLMLRPLSSPGKSLCRKIDSDWFGSCIVSSSSCCYSKIEFIPDKMKNSFMLEKCSSFYWEVLVESKMYSDYTNKEMDLLLQAGTLTSNKVGEFMISSVSEPFVSAKTKCIMTELSSKSISLVDCSNKDEHIKGKIGEIRCPRDPRIDTKGCVLSPDLIRTDIQGFNIILDSEVLDLVNIHSQNLIPLRNLNYEFDVDNRGYFFNNPKYNVFKISIKLHDFKVASTVKNTDCSFKFISLKGCHSCPMGGQLSIKASCTDYPNLAFIKCSQGPSTPFIVSSVSEIDVRFSSNSSVVDEECIVNVNKFSHNLKIMGTLLTQIDDLNILQEDKEKAVKVTFGILNNNFLDTLTKFVSSIFSSWRLWFIILVLIGLILGLYIIKTVLALGQNTHIKAF